MLGSWEGMGQEDQGAVWTVNLTAENKEEISISYPGVETVSEWELIFKDGDQIAYLEYNTFGSEYEVQYYVVLVNRISDDLLEIRYFDFDPEKTNPYNMFDSEKLMATAMVKRRMGAGNMCKSSSSRKSYNFIPEPVKWEKVAKYKPE